MFSSFSLLLTPSRQAQKFPTDEAYAEQIRLADTPLTAKKLGKNRSHPHRDDWEEVLAQDLVSIADSSLWRLV